MFNRFFSNAVGYGVSQSMLELNATKEDETTVYKCMVNIGFLDNVLSQSITVKFSKFILDDLVFPYISNVYNDKIVTENFWGQFKFCNKTFPSQWIQGKVANLESMASVHCTILLEHVIKMTAYYFDTDFVSQMKLITLPLIPCFALFAASSEAEQFSEGAILFTLLTAKYLSEMTDLRYRSVILFICICCKCNIWELTKLFSKILSLYALKPEDCAHLFWLVINVPLGNLKLIFKTMIKLWLNIKKFHVWQ